MPGSATSVYSEAEDFEAAIRAEGCLGLLVTGPGQFRARLTQVGLHRLRLSATDEPLARVALVAVPVDMILVSLPLDTGSTAISGGIRVGAGELTTLGPGQRSHMRTEGPCRWGSIQLPAADLLRYGSVLTGAAFAVPSAIRSWRPRRAENRLLLHLHSVAISLVERGSSALVEGEAAHGLEQQLIEAVVDCLSKGLVIDTSPAMYERQDVALRFGAMLQAQPARAYRMTEICSTLGVSAQTLRLSCEEQLGMGPAEYVHRRRMELAHRELRHGNHDTTTISAVARIRFPRSWAVRRLLSRPLRRAAVGHFAARLGGCGAVCIASTAREGFVTTLTWINVMRTVVVV